MTNRAERPALDAHPQALNQDTTPTAVQKQALSGLDIVDLMETAFLGK